jgi:Domain of unknown function (DUF4114)
MTEIKLGQSISASFTSSDTQSVDLNNSLTGTYYNEYDLPGLDSFRQLNFTVQRPTGTIDSTTLESIDVATGAVIAQSIQAGAGIFSLLVTTFPGINYKVRVTNSSLGDYQLSLTDGGKATSIVSPQVANAIDNNTNSLVGTIGQSGTYFSLASGGKLKLTDIAFAPDGQFYGIGAAATPAATDLLYRIDPSLDRSGQVKLVGEIKDTQGTSLSSSIQALEFAADNKLYGLGYAAEGAKLYQIDVTTNIATVLATLPQAFLIGGDLVYDAPNQRFLATSLDATNTSSDALWQIPLANPASATKIGMTGFTDVYGLAVENGQLFGYTANIAPDATGSKRIELDLTTGKGTFDRVITGTQTFGIGGAATIPGAGNEGLVLNVVSLNSVAITSAVGSKSQGLAQSNTIDLSDYAGKTLTVDVTTKSDAAYTNNIGFYIVEDSIGTIKLADGSTLKPNDANYAVEAIKSALTNLLQATKSDIKLGQNITGGRIYAPVVIAQGSLTDFVSKNPTNGGGANDIHAYFNYVSANSDGVDHFKLLGNNTFGVEDMYGGGDRDFNDLVINMNIKAA